MDQTNLDSAPPLRFRAPVVAIAFALLCITVTTRMPSMSAQELNSPIIEAEDIRSVMNDAPEQKAAASDQPSGIDLLSLITRGGKFMIPIGLMSVLVVTLAVERLLSLRRRKVVPRRLERELRDLAEPISIFDPAAALRICQNYRCVASRVVQTMLQRTGQPIGDIERAATETAQREADRYATPIRWLNLAAAATPLMGLLGTVWGMIVAFHESTTLTADRSRSEQLSEGIYTALVTTLAGLIVAIPAAMLAQYLENRVSKLFGRVEQLAFDLAPGLSRFVGNSRLNDRGTVQAIDNIGRAAKAPTPPPVSDGGTRSKPSKTTKTPRGGIGSR